MQKPIYLDNHATTPVDPRVLEAMLPYFGPRFGNASSRSHSFGWTAEKAVDFARKRIAELAGAAQQEIVFTSGATESNNLAIKGLMEAHRSKGNHLVTMATEHRAVLDPIRHLESQGCRSTILAPRRDGLSDLDELRRAIRPETVLVSVMWANNEIGIIQPVREIGAICRERGVFFHCDATQAFGKVPIDVMADNIDLMSVSAHKMYGPKGVGALYVRRRRPQRVDVTAADHKKRWSAPLVTLTAQMDGGGHESGMRSGTLNVPAIVGFGEACAICGREMLVESARIQDMRDRFWSRICAALEGVTPNGSMEQRLPGNLNLSFAGVDAETLIMGLPDIALSTGSACSSATVEPSHVLRALGIGEMAARSSVRFGLGRFNTEEELDYVAARIVETVRKLRSFAPSEV